MGKYGNKRVEMDGYVFDSVAERNHYISLKLLAHAGEICQLQVHPKYILLEGFKHAATGKRVRAITYLADFAYVENGQPVTIDVKGARTEAYRIKSKLFMARYPHIRFEEVAA
jgi:hypothetical protein